MNLEKQLDLLKDKAPTSGAGGEEGSLGKRLAKLQQDAGVLANTTENMLKSLEGSALLPMFITCAKVKAIKQKIKKNIHTYSTGKNIHPPMLEPKASGCFSPFENLMLICATQTIPNG